MNFTIRANYTFSQNVIDYFEENKLPYDYLSVTGKPFNILRGYISEGCSPVKRRSIPVLTKVDSERYVPVTLNIVM